MTDAAGSEAWSYDVMGRPLADQRTTNSVTKTTSYTYNLDGSVASLSYPSGRVVTYTPSGAGRTLSAADSIHSINYATGAMYSPAGALSSLTNGANTVSTLFYNSRLQPCRISVKSSGAGPGNCSDTTNVGNVLDLSYNFALGTANNGNVMAIASNRDGTRSQSFTYDQLNRLATAKTSSTTGTNCWGETFSYDIWANLLSIGAVSGYTGCTQENLSVTATTSNRVSGDTYDASGNLSIIPGTGGATYGYNGESQLTSANGISYTYDGDGRRVQKSSGKLYWYGMSSDALDETDLSGNLTSEYIFFGGKRIARRDSSGNVNYYFADHLGTARIVTNATGTVCYDADFYPFGGERTAYTNTCPQNYKFTGKERDGESGLDNFGARYNSSQLGRFLSPDPVTATPLHIINPQRWNMYAYGMNNPLFYIDPSGKDAIAVNFSKQDPIVGHEGIISVHADGSATYASFGPATKGEPFDKGHVTSQTLPTKVQFGQNGLPTPNSYAALTKEAGKIEGGQDPSTVRMNYFKTSEADTIALDNWINAAQEASNQGNVPPYVFCTSSNCAGFATLGLLAGKAINVFQASQLSIVPNILFLQLELLANQNYTPPKPKPHVTSKICNADGTHCVPVN